MRFLCFVAYLIGPRRILFLVFILMAIAIVQRNASASRQLAAPMRSTPTAPQPEPHPESGASPPRLASFGKMLVTPKPTPALGR
jgi:hypothetical protein